jgi:hypothetical protein
LDTEDFLRTVFGDNEGFLFLSSKDSPSDTEITIHKAFNYPASMKTIVTYVEMRDDIDLYFSPMLFKVPLRRQSSVSFTPALYADTDAFPVEGFLVKPSINIETSPGRHASLWLLDGVYDPQQVAAASRAIALTHASVDEHGRQAGVDPGGWDLTQLLRMPNSTNMKYEVPGKYEGYTKPYPVFVDEATSDLTIYSLKEITDTYDPQNLPAMPERASVDMPDEDALPKQSDVLRKVTSSHTLSSLYSKEPASGDRSDTLYHFISECLRAGLTAEETFVVGWYAASNKYRIDGRSRDDFWTYDMRKALADPMNRPRPTLDIEPEDTYLNPKDEGISAQVDFALLKEGEFETRTFVNEYTEWASSKTDAPTAYHRASALAILSAVFGEWGVALPKYGDLNLGLSFVIMGETTKTRKSTARGYMRKFLRMCEDEDHTYLLTSDATEEALLDALAERPNMSSLYDRDEAQKLIADVKGQKGYMKGFLETLNKLYDGEAHGRLRTTKHTEDTPVVFIQYLMGIRSQIQENLEVSDFASGWGPRNIYVRGEASSLADELIEQQSEADFYKGGDPVLDRLVSNIVTSRARWEKKCKSDRTNPIRVRFDPESWHYLVTIQRDLENFFANHPRFEDTLSPCISRLQNNCIKVASLLAMASGRANGEMGDVINVRSYASKWVEDLLIMIEGVSESEFTRQLETFKLYIASRGNSITETVGVKWAHSQGKNLKEYSEIVENLVARGELVVGETKKGKTLQLVDGD